MKEKNMGRFVRAKWMALTVAMFFLVPMVSTALAGEVTIVGEVNDNYQIISEGQIYEIADTAEGNELAENNISAKVKVTGTVEERDEMKIITVISFQVLGE
jgi:hypothetical protein